MNFKNSDRRCIEKRDLSTSHLFSNDNSFVFNCYYYSITVFKESKERKLKVRDLDYIDNRCAHQLSI